MSDTTDPTIMTLADLQEILAIFDLASSRGAFRGNELAMVGSKYNKLANFIQLAQNSQNTQPPVENTGETVGN